eukprot:CAMPEP_0174381630 /NCGR_PEP_ID=MMETSP0811_2-20130205/124143_1 /TAXON_ID=73025 ORGANISM="Eutreptiella gymnastica-like, Strain CCMP1594" /NCGR_SAMPLE_ID=MMETSP0811_2 /ASSEMBLY_ACC=CAM_ASM_000667 /LENGTH=102 /DNA_ID=CAMNT_0015534837 /DNA_START=225 /DNA_END=534 /DNA_ORIENTATION=+
MRRAACDEKCRVALVTDAGLDARTVQGHTSECQLCAQPHSICAQAKLLVLASIFVPTVLNKDETETETATGRVLVYMDTDHRGIGCSLLAWGGASPGRCAND